MTFRLGDIAPNFEADTTHGHINFHDWAGDSWIMFFSHPKDYTPVCTTELGETGRLWSEFDRRGVKPIALSVDSVNDHNGWKKDIEEVGDCEINFPIIADPERKIAELYGMLPATPPQGLPLTVRVVFLIDPSKKIRWMIAYPASCGRNFDEILRCIDAIQLSDKVRIATPVNWRPGDDVVIVTSVKDDEAKKLFPQGWRTVKPYLRMVSLNQEQTNQ